MSPPAPAVTHSTNPTTAVIFWQAGEPKPQRGNSIKTPPRQRARALIYSRKGAGKAFSAARQYFRNYHHYTTQIRLSRPKEWGTRKSQGSCPGKPAPGILWRVRPGTTEKGAGNLVCSQQPRSGKGPSLPGDEAGPRFGGAARETQACPAPGAPAQPGPPSPLSRHHPRPRRRSGSRAYPRPRGAAAMAERRRPAAA